MQGGRVEGLRGKGEGRQKEKETDGTVGLCFVLDLWDTVHEVKGKEGPLDH